MILNLLYIFVMLNNKPYKLLIKNNNHENSNSHCSTILQRTDYRSTEKDSLKINAIESVNIKKQVFKKQGTVLFTM